MATQLDENTQYIDESTGELLNNGYIYIGLDGLDAKLNPKPIYSDRALSVSLVNPQRIGADGRALNKIWIDGKYSLKVEDSGRNQKLNDLSLGDTTQYNNTSLINVQGTDSLIAEGSTAVPALVNNQVYVFTAANTNTGAMTLAIDLLSAYPIKKQHDQDMQAGDIEANQTVALIWNETDSTFELMTNSAIGPVTTANPQTITGVKTFTDGIVSDLNGPTSVGGILKLAEGASIASAADCNIWANLDGNTAHLTGTTPVTDWGAAPQAGASMRVICDTATPLTYNATTNDMNTGGADYTTSAGDVLIVYARTVSSYKVTIIPYDGKQVLAIVSDDLPSGSVVQVVNVQDGAVATGTTALPNDNTIPQNTEGDEYMTLAITPTSTTNKLKIDIVGYFSSGTATQVLGAALFQDSTADAIAAGSMLLATSGGQDNVAFTHYMTAGTTSATTFKVRAGTAISSTVTFNGSAGVNQYGGVIASSITITEIQV